MKKFSLKQLFHLSCWLCFGSWMGAQAQLPLVWQSEGPDNLGGRTRAIAYSQDGSTVYAGSTGGGLYQTSNLGESWSPVSSYVGNQIISSIAIKGSKIFVGTGELVFYTRQDDPLLVKNKKNGSLGYSGFMGQGVYVSLDNGVTFSNVNASWPHGSTPMFNDPFTSVQKVTVSPTGNRVFAATLRGLYFTDDDFTSINIPSGPAELTNDIFVEVEFLADGITVLAATPSKLFISNDGGASFSQISDATITGSATTLLGGSRIVVAAAPADANTVYVSGCYPFTDPSKGGRITGVFKSTDKGATWARIAPAETYVDEANMGWFAPHSVASNKVRGQGRYAFTLKVSPLSADLLYLGGQTFMIYSPTLGWRTIGIQTDFPGNVNYVPANVHTMAFNPIDPQQFFLGTDRQIVRSTNAGGNIITKSKGYVGAELFGVGVSPEGGIVAGSSTHGLINKIPTLSNSKAYTNGFEGVGGRVAASIIPAKHDFTQRKYDNFLGGRTQGLLTRTTNKGENYELFFGYPLSPNPFGTLATDTIIDASSSSSNLGRPNDYAAYINTFLLDEYLEYGNPSVGQKNLTVAYYATNRYIWTILNPFATPSATDIEVPSWTRITPALLTSGEIGTDVEKNPLNVISAMAVSNDVNHTLFVGTSNGKLFRILRPHEPLLIDTFAPYKQINALNMPARWITSIAVDPTNPANIVVTYGGYETASGDPRVMASSNALDSVPVFVDITGNLPNIPVYASHYHPNSPLSGFVLGTEWGIYSTSNYVHGGTAPSWAETNNNDLKRVPVMEIKSKRFTEGYEHDPNLYIATFGRGVLRTSSLVSNQPLITTEAGFNASVFPNPMGNKGSVEYSLSNATSVKIEVYSITGNLIKTLFSGKEVIGKQTVEFNTEDLQAGIYLIKFSLDENGLQSQHTLKTVVVH